MAKTYIVWNEAKTEGFVTKDAQLAYQVRKSAYTNCYDADGVPSYVAIEFCDTWCNDNCTIQELDDV